MKKTNLKLEQHEEFKTIIDGEWNFNTKWLKDNKMSVALLPMRYSKPELLNILSALKKEGANNGYAIETCYLDKEFIQSDPGSFFEFELDQVGINQVCNEGPELDHIIFTDKHDFVIMSTLEEYWMVASNEHLLEEIIGKPSEIIISEFKLYIASNQWSEQELKYLNGLIMKYPNNN